MKVLYVAYARFFIAVAETPLDALFTLLSFHAAVYHYAAAACLPHLFFAITNICGAAVMRFVVAPRFDIAIVTPGQLRRLPPPAPF